MAISLGADSVFPSNLNLKKQLGRGARDRLIHDLTNEVLSDFGKLTSTRILRRTENKETWLMTFRDGRTYTLKMHAIGVGSIDDFFVGSVEDRCRKSSWICSNREWRCATPQLIKDGRWQWQNGSNQEFHYSLARYIPGENLRCVNPTSIPYRKLFNQLGVLCREIHQTPGSGHGQKFDAKTSRLSYDSWSDYINDRIGYIPMEDVLSTQVIGHEEASRAKKLWEDLKALDVTPCFFHHDLLYNAGNILVDLDFSVLAILDWEYAGCGQPMVMELGVSDFAFFRSGLDKNSRETLISYFLEGYETSISNLRKNHRRHIDAVSLLYAFARVGSLYSESKSRVLEIHTLKNYIKEKLRGY